MRKTARRSKFCLEISCPSSSNSIAYLCHLLLFSVQGERAIKIQLSKRTKYLGRVLAVLFVERLHVIHKLVQAWQTCKWLQLVQHQQLSCYAYTRCFSLCQKNFRLRNKWNAASVRVEICGPPSKVLSFQRTLPFHFQKFSFLVLLFNMLSSNHNFDRNPNGLRRFDWKFWLIEQCGSIFSWAFLWLLTFCLANGKHPPWVPGGGVLP